VPRRTRGQRVFDVLLVGLILGNVLAVILGTVESIGVRYESFLFGFEVLSVSVFTLELLLRFWVSDLSADGAARQPRWRFWFNPYTVTDVLAIAPFYLSFFFNLDLRLLRLLRLFRVFRISPYFRSLTLLGSVIRQEYRPMLSALAVISILMLFAAGAIYLLEREGQPETFGDLPSSLWWIVVTLSTVGYGDAVPLTWLGRALGAVIMILGIGMSPYPPACWPHASPRSCTGNETCFATWWRRASRPAAAFPRSSWSSAGWSCSSAGPRQKPSSPTASRIRSSH
jgi:voltage-gated potassium channel